MGFLVKCPQCGSLIAPGPCPSCHYSPKGADGDEKQESHVEEYQRRHQVHVRNYTIFMVLMFATGIVGLLCAYMWFRIIFCGSIDAFVMVALLTIVAAILGVCLKLCKHWFPVEINCPSCSVRLDEIGLESDRCPGCDAKLR